MCVFQEMYSLEEGAYVLHSIGNEGASLLFYLMTPTLLSVGKGVVGVKSGLKLCAE